MLGTRRPSRRLELSSWDRTKLPRPFGRGAVAWDGPYLCLPADASGEADIAQLGLPGLGRRPAHCRLRPGRGGPQQ